MTSPDNVPSESTAWSIITILPVSVSKYILLTKCKGHTGRISTLSLDSMDHAQRDPYQGPIFSLHGPEQAWLIRDLLHEK